MPPECCIPRFGSPVSRDSPRFWSDGRLRWSADSVFLFFWEWSVPRSGVAPAQQRERALRPRDKRFTLAARRDLARPPLFMAARCHRLRRFEAGAPPLQPLCQSHRPSNTAASRLCAVSSSACPALRSPRAGTKGWQGWGPIRPFSPLVSKKETMEQSQYRSMHVQSSIFPEFH